MFPWMGCNDKPLPLLKEAGPTNTFFFFFWYAETTVQSEREKGVKERPRKIRRFVVSYRSQWEVRKVASFKGTGCLNR